MFYVNNNFKCQTYSVANYAELAAYFGNMPWTDYNSQTAMDSLLLGGVLSVTQGSNMETIDCYFSTDEYRVAFFVEGPDGVGKTSVFKDFQHGVYSHMAEFSSEKSDVHNSDQFKPFSQIMSNHQMTLTTAMLTFANRYFNFENYIKTWELRQEIIISDRSWLTALAYQGQSSEAAREIIFKMGMEFNNWLISNKIIPVYIILTNPPYVSKGDESLDDLSTGSIEHYNSMVPMLRDQGVLAINATANNASGIISTIATNMGFDHPLLKEEPVVIKPFFRALMDKLIK